MNKRMNMTNNNVVNIDVNTLKKVCRRIIEVLEDNYDGEVSLSFDYYNKVSGEDFFDINSSPKINIGSTVDDWRELQKLIKDPDRPCTFVDFDRVAGILNAISQELNPI